MDIFEMKFSKVFPLLIAKAVRKGRTEGEVFAVTGWLTGYSEEELRAEPDNAHDPRAQVVVRADGKQLGYIPRAALDEFGAFNPKNLPCPFTGRITVDTSNHLYGTLHISQPGF